MKVEEIIAEWRKGCSCVDESGYPGTCAECTNGMVDAISKRVTLLKAEVNSYLDDPGCNAPARGNKMRKLRWAMDRT